MWAAGAEGRWRPGGQEEAKPWMVSLSSIAETGGLGRKRGKKVGQSKEVL